MLKSSGAMGAATLVSRILGMVREVVYARFMGDGWVASAFVFAFMIPNLFRRLLGEGALTAAFIPIFKSKERNEGEKEMWRAANAVISGLVASASILIALAIGGLSLFLATGWVQGETRLMLSLLRIMFPYMLLVCLAAVYMGMLNSRKHFFIPAMGSIMLNLVMIASVLFLAPWFGQELPTQIYALACGVLVAGAAQAAFQLPTLWKEGYRSAWVTPWNDPTVKEVCRKMLPGMMGVAAFQLNVVATQSLAFAVDSQIVASFSYAVRLMELPQGVFGISLATYLLPTLSGLAAEKRYDDFRATLRQGLGYLCFVNLLASVLLVVLAAPMIRLLFERGQFDAASTSRAAVALACLAPGLVAFSVVNILARAFYALGDTKIPMQISVVCLVLNLVFAGWLVFPFRQGGLGLANSMSSILNVALLFYALKKKLGRLDLEPMKRQVLTMTACAILAGLIAWMASHFWESRLGHRSLTLQIGAVFVPAGLAFLAYWVASCVGGIPEAREMKALVWQRIGKIKG
jgi:putative peptidoglycan lipid II flippase